MSSCWTRRHVFLFYKRTCLLVEQEDTSSSRTRRHVLLQCYIIRLLYYYNIILYYIIVLYYYITIFLHLSMMLGRCLVDVLSTLGDVWPMLGRCLVDVGSFLSSFGRVCCWLGDIIGSCLAISEVILIILNVVLDNFSDLDNQNLNTFPKIGS